MPHNLNGTEIFADDMYCPACGHHDRSGKKYCTGWNEMGRPMSSNLKHKKTKRISYLDATKARVKELQNMQDKGIITEENAANLEHERWQLEYLLRPENRSYASRH